MAPQMLTKPVQRTETARICSETDTCQVQGTPNGALELDHKAKRYGILQSMHVESNM